MFVLIVCGAFSGIARRCCVLSQQHPAPDILLFRSPVAVHPPTAIQLLPARPDARCLGDNQPWRLRPGDGENSQVLSGDDEEEDEDEEEVDPRCEQR